MEYDFKYPTMCAAAMPVRGNANLFLGDFDSFAANSRLPVIMVVNSDYTDKTL